MRGIKLWAFNAGVLTRGENAPHTHACMDRGKLNVPPHRMGEFRMQLVRNFLRGDANPDFLVEIGTPRCPWVADLDLLLAHEPTTADLVDLGGLVRDAVAHHTGVGRPAPPCIIASRPPDAKADGTWGAGLHLYFPTVIVTQSRALALREAVRAHLDAHGPPPPAPKTWDDILDASIYRGGSRLRMLGSRKAAHCRECKALNRPPPRPRPAHGIVGQNSPPRDVHADEAPAVRNHVRCGLPGCVDGMRDQGRPYLPVATPGYDDEPAFRGVDWAARPLPLEALMAAVTLTTLRLEGTPDLTPLWGVRGLADGSTLDVSPSVLATVTQRPPLPTPQGYEAAVAPSAPPPKAKPKAKKKRKASAASHDNPRPPKPPKAARGDDQGKGKGKEEDERNGAGPADLKPFVNDQRAVAALQPFIARQDPAWAGLRVKRMLWRDVKHQARAKPTPKEEEDPYDRVHKKAKGAVTWSRQWFIHVASDDAGVNTCQQKGGAHGHSEIYFFVTKAGIRQKCWSPHCEGKVPRLWKPTQAIMDALYPPPPLCIDQPQPAGQPPRSLMELARLSFGLAADAGY